MFNKKFHENSTVVSRMQGDHMDEEACKKLYCFLTSTLLNKVP